VALRADRLHVGGADPLHPVERHHPARGIGPADPRARGIRRRRRVLGELGRGGGFEPQVELAPSPRPRSGRSRRGGAGGARRGMKRSRRARGEAEGVRRRGGRRAPTPGRRTLTATSSPVARRRARWTWAMEAAATGFGEVGEDLVHRALELAGDLGAGLMGREGGERSWRTRSWRARSSPPRRAAWTGPART
jgi:hypothetical protein